MVDDTHPDIVPSTPDAPPSQGTRAPAANGPPMVAVLSLVPVGLGLFLLVFGVPGRTLLAPTPLNLAGVGLVALIVGPVALLALGVVGWLVVIALLVGTVLVTAGLKPPRRGALQE